MAQAHLDRLSAVDASFLLQERPSTHMHIGGCARLEGPTPFFEDLREHVRSRLHLVPRYRQKLAEPPAGLGRWRWVDDPTFNLDFHLRHTALPTPGDDERLRRLAARVFAQRLDRGKPLWELWIVEGLHDGGWAILSKTHHALVDGVGGVDLLTVLFDVGPEPVERARAPMWVPRPEPSRAQLAADALSSTAQTAAELPVRVLGVLTDARETLSGLGSAARGVLDAAPASPLNVPIGPHRRLAFVGARLADLKAVKDTFGGTVNDVVLTSVAGALRALYEHRGLPTDGVELKACVPVSTRGTGDREAGNRITQVMAPLALGTSDPVARLRAIGAAMAGIKDSRQAVGAELIAGAQDFAPPTILAQASRLNFSSRLYNLLVTNVPGPQVPLFILGRRMEQVFPIPFLAGDRSLAIAVMSYDGAMGFGLLADLDALEELDVVATAIRATLAELVGRVSA